MTHAQIKAAAAAVFLVAAAAVLFWPVTVLTVRVLRPIPVVMDVRPVAPGSDVRIYYRHSVERTPVEGRFAVSEDLDLVAVQTRLTSTGTGLPNTATERMHREGDWYVVDEQRRLVSPLRFYLQSVNRTRLTVDGRAVDLSAYRSGSLLGIRVERIGQWRWWRWRWSGKGWQPKEEPEGFQNE